MIREAIFSDETCSYVNPAEPSAYDDVSISIRVAKDDVDKVELLHGKDFRQESGLKKYYSDLYFDYYRLYIDMPDTVFRYIFRISKDEEVLYFDRVGISEGMRVFQSFELIPDFKTPEWAQLRL